MTTSNVFTKIRFSPTKYSLELQAKLEYLDILWGPEDEEEILEIVNQNSDIAECQLALAALYADQNKMLKHYTTIEKAYVLHPQHIEVKAQLAQAKYFDYTDKYHKEKFEKIFAPEIDCLINDKMLPNIISDTELRILLITLNKFFVATKQKEKYLKIFRFAQEIQFDDLPELLAFVIKGEDMPTMEIDFHLHANIRFWFDETFEQLLVHRINNRPYYDLFYILLNKPAEDISQAEITELSNLDDLTKIQHDIVWLLTEGLIRTNNQIGECNQDYFLNALYVAGHYDLAELNRLFLVFLSGMPEQIVDRILGDIGTEIIGAPLQKLGIINLRGFLEMLTYTEDVDDEEEFDEIYDSQESDNYWYIKSIVLNILGSIAAIDNSRQEEAELLIRTLWNHYSEHDHEMLGWTFYTIMEYEIDGFTQDIEKAYTEDKIDTMVHGDIEDYRAEISASSSDINLLFEPASNVDAFYQQLRNGMEKISSHQKKEVKDEESQINWIVESSHEKNRRLKEIMETDDFEDNSILSNPETYQRKQPKIGRNDPCPCGSGKKYKKCCLVMIKN